MSVILHCILFIKTMINVVQAVTLSPDTFRMQGFLSEGANSIIKRNQIISSNNKMHEYTFVNQTFGVLSSPGYPLWYTSNLTCKWQIDMKKDSQVVLTIRQFFLADGDVVEVHYGQNKQAYTLQNAPHDFLFLPSEKVTVILKSTSFEVHKPRFFYAMFEEEGCGGTLRQSSGYINVPFYVHGTKRPHECVWTIEATREKVVTLEFLDFDVEPGSCVYNNMYIRDGDQTAGYILGDFCEENPPYSKLRSSTNVMSIAYRTRPNLFGNQPMMLPTIKMFYKIVDSCGGALEGYSGFFRSPEHWLLGQSSCNWTITVPESKIILLKLKHWRKQKTDDFNTQEQVRISTEQDEILWELLEDDLPPESIIIPSNQGNIDLIAKGNETYYSPHLHFQAFYEAVLPTAHDCFQISHKQFFMCSDETYIDCSKRCDGIEHCSAGDDEEDCPKMGIRRTLDHINPHDSKQKPIKTRRWSYNFILWIVAIVASCVVVMLVVMGDVVFRKSKRNSYTTFKENLNESLAFTEEPPSYDSLCGGSRDEGEISANRAEFISSQTSYGFPLNLQSAESSSNESLYHLRHSTPFYIYNGSRSTLGSSESLPLHIDLKYNYMTSSTDGSNESIARIPTTKRYTPLTSMFHDTNVIESTVSTTSTTPVQFFHYSDTLDDHEAFLKEMRMPKPEA